MQTQMPRILLTAGEVRMPKQLMVSALCLAVLAGQISAGSVLAGNSNATGAKHDSLRKGSQRARASHRSCGLVPPPPPTTVPPGVLYLYGQQGSSLRFPPAKPHNLADDMKLTAVMDDVAFFRLRCTDESIHLKTGATYESVTVAQINPDQVVLEEKGVHFVKHLK
jgi:hypothetical protein